MKDRVSDFLTADGLKAVLLEDGGQVPLGQMPKALSRKIQLT